MKHEDMPLLRKANKTIDPNNVGIIENNLQDKSEDFPQKQKRGQS